MGTTVGKFFLVVYTRERERERGREREREGAVSAGLDLSCMLIVDEKPIFRVRVRRVSDLGRRCPCITS